MKQGTLPGTAGAWASNWPKARPVQVRASVRAKKRCSKTPWSKATQEGRCEMEQNDESQKLTGTSAEAKSAAMPGGDILLRWKWVERSVWTDSMLKALERGVKGGKWYSLMDTSINAGPMPILTSWASGGWLESTDETHQPGETADWRAVCGKTACTVRREGERHAALPTPIYDRCASFAQVSLSATVRLKTNFPAVESGSTEK